jgi:phospholipase/carboxylesterase
MSLGSYIFRERTMAEGAPLFLAFHGTGGDENQFFGLAEELVPEASVIAPRGDVLEYGAARFFRRKAEGVYDMADLTARAAKMAAFVEAHRQRLRPSRVIGLGYSNGANILASVVFARPDLFDDIVLMHPLIPWRPADNAGLAEVRTLITAGRSDPICPAPMTESLADYFRANAKSVELEWHAGGHEARSSEFDAAARFIRAPRPRSLIATAAGRQALEDGEKTR